MWYENAKPFIESGELAILGVVQEQHAERARLYRQWKQFDFPIVQDATTSLDLNAVPVPILIDETGIVRDNRPKPGGLSDFVASSFDSPDENSESTKAEAEKQPAAPINRVRKLIAEGNQLLHLTDDQKLGEAIDRFKQAVELDPENGKALFSLGVALRTRFDSQSAEPDDFQNASRNWSRALKINPNQYIWRRRIEQYGPRQIKPYPFYDWVGTAIADIKQRGEKPVVLSVPLTGAEIAKPERKFKSDDTDLENPDPESLIFPDENGLVALSAVAVPASVKKGEVARIHLNLRPVKGKWNDEAGPIKVWIDKESSGAPERQLIEHFARESADTENRSIDFEFKTDEETGASQVRGFVLYHTCDREGVCFYNRQNFIVDINVK